MLERVTDLGITRAVVSVSVPALVPIDAVDRPRVARACNAAIAAMRDRNPDLIGGFAVLPMPDVAESMNALGHALDVLRFNGVSLLTNYGGVYLGDPSFEPVLAELDRRAAVAHVHPNLLRRWPMPTCCCHHRFWSSPSTSHEWWQR